MLLRSCLLCLFLSAATFVSAQDNVTDRDRLGMALEYFQTGKYHEALLLFENLERRYTLNPRYHAYMGMCLYHVWDYEKAAKKLSECLPKLESLSPRERSVYCFTCAESYFFLHRYKDAVPYYEQMLLLCHDNERADALFRLGFCYMQLGEAENALEYLEAACAHYERFPNKDKEARLIQIGNMIKGLKKLLNDKDESDGRTE